MRKIIKIMVSKVLKPTIIRVSLEDPIYYKSKKLPNKRL